MMIRILQGLAIIALFTNLVLCFSDLFFIKIGRGSLEIAMEILSIALLGGVLWLLRYLNH